ncbi:MAG: hypothetical protein KTR20_10860 [Cellvibrionaceae bacterium]|nr:hypothetical protein [Cellvibrionaceae bacterium]
MQHPPNRQKNIYLTLVLSIGFMVLVLALFVNKMMTPRYLSALELKINGLMLLEQAAAIDGLEADGTWRLLSDAPQAREFLQRFIATLPNKIQQKTQGIALPPERWQVLANKLPSNNVIAIVNQQGQLMAYFTPPFNHNKMKLTYASVVAHR